MKCTLLPASCTWSKVIYPCMSHVEHIMCVPTPLLKQSGCVAKT